MRNNHLFVYASVIVLALAIVAGLKALHTNKQPALFGAAPISHTDRTILPQTTDTYELGTSTDYWLRTFTRTLCLDGDCRSTWPAGSGSSFSTTSADYWKTQNNFYSTTSAAYHIGTFDKGYFFSTTSALAHLTSIDKGYFFSTTSANYWKGLQGFFGTTSLSASAPLFYNTNTAALTWYGLSTSSQPASSNLLVSNGSNGVFGVATSTLTPSSPLTGSFVQIGSGGSLGCAPAADGTSGCITGVNHTLFTGRVATGSAETKGNLAFWLTTSGGQPKLGSVATNTASCSGTVSCSAFTIIGGSAVTITGSGSGAWPFTPSTSYNVAVQSTSTPLALTAGVFASSTSHFVNWDAISATTTNLSITNASTSNFWISSIRNGVLSTNGIGAVAATSTGIVTATSPVTVTAGRSVIGGSAVFAWDFSVANTWTGRQTFNTGGVLINASSTIQGSVFPAINRFGLASSSCSALWGGCIGTSTVMFGGFSIAISSSTANTANVIPNWRTTNTVTVMLQQTSTVDLSGTSTGATDGQYVTLQACQDGTGNRPLTFIGVNTPVWGLPEGTTTVRQAAYNLTRMGIQYQNRGGTLYPVVLATSSISDTRLCR